jgi:hypothetical protein
MKYILFVLDYESILCTYICKHTMYIQAIYSDTLMENFQFRWLWVTIWREWWKPLHNAMTQSMNFANNLMRRFYNQKFPVRDKPKSLFIHCYIDSLRKLHLNLSNWSKICIVQLGKHAIKRFQNGIWARTTEMNRLFAD